MPGSPGDLQKPYQTPIRHLPIPYLNYEKSYKALILRKLTGMRFGVLGYLRTVSFFTVVPPGVRILMLVYHVICCPKPEVVFVAFVF